MSKKVAIWLIVGVLVLSIACTTVGVVAFCIKNVSFSYDVSMQREPYQYPIELTLEYEMAMTKVVGDASLLVGDAGILKDNIWTAFSNARVSERTITAFVAEINSYDWSDENTPAAQFASKFFTLSEDESNKIISAATEDDMLDAILATFVFLDKIGATADEIGRFSYHLVYQYADSTHRALMDRATVDNWTMLTVGTYTASQLATSTDVYSSLTSARAVGQALTSLGHAYSAITDAVGKDNLATMLGIDNLKNIDESNLENGRLDEYRQCVDWMCTEFAEVFMTSADLMKAQNTLLYEELYLYQAKLDRGEDTDTHLVYAMYNLAQGIKTAINRLKSRRNLSSDVETVTYIAEYYASCATFTDVIYGDDRGSLVSYRNDAIQELTRINEDAGNLYAQEFSSFYQVKKCKTDNPALFDSLLTSAQRLLNTKYDYEDILTRFVYSVSIASIVALI